VEHQGLGAKIALLLVRYLETWAQGAQYGHEGEELLIVLVFVQYDHSVVVPRLEVGYLQLRIDVSSILDCCTKTNLMEQEKE
jgi:hypothetical protein